MKSVYVFTVHFITVIVHMTVGLNSLPDVMHFQEPSFRGDLSDTET